MKQPPVVNDFSVAVTLAFARRNTFDYRPPLAITLAHDEPPYASEYETAFGAPVTFGAPYNTVVIAREYRVLASTPPEGSAYSPDPSP